MKLDGRRTSSNVSDRRGVSGKTLGVGGGIVGVIVAAVITLLSGGNLGDVLMQVGPQLLNQNVSFQLLPHHYTSLLAIKSMLIYPWNCEPTN